MNWFLRELERICIQRPVDEKLLVVPSYIAGRELLEALARSTAGWVNLYPVTVPSLALELVGPRVTESRLQYINRLRVVHIVEDIFTDLQKQKRLRYFKPVGQPWGLLEALTSAILEIRSCGLKSGQLYEDLFVVPDKGHDIIAILKLYEEHLKKEGLFDAPGTLEMAIEELKKSPQPRDRVYLLPFFLQLSPLENEFLKNLAGDSFLLLGPDGHTGSAGLEAGHGVVEMDCKELISEELEVDFFQAYGLINEVREVLRRVNEQKIPLDRVTVAYTSPDYATAFWSASRAIGFEVSLFEGLPAAMTRTGRVLLGLIEWINRSFSARWLGNLFNECNIELTGNGFRVSGAEAARLLDRAEVGWSRERYVLLEKLAQKLESIAAQIEKGEREDEEDRYYSAAEMLEEARSARCLHEHLQAILEHLSYDDPGQLVKTGELAGALLKALNELCPEHAADDEVERSAREKLTRLLTEGLGTPEVKLKDALGRLESLVKECPIGASNGRPGTLQIVHYSNLIWTDRPYTFVLGLDAASFPGRGGQDPVLLDSERQRLHPDLRLNRDVPLRNEKLMELGLYTREGRLTLSYSCFDIAENRPSFPAFELLKVFRRVKDDERIDYSEMLRQLGNPASFASKGRELGENEWILSGLVEGKTLDATFAGKHYPGLASGLKALAGRQNAVLGEYDGLIGPDVSLQEYDPRDNKDLVVSCTMIETLAKCPFAYFMRYILGVKAPERIEPDPERWLSRLDRGKLLHDLYCEFMRRLTGAGERVDYGRHIEPMKELALTLLELQKKQLPPANDLLYQIEKTEIIKCCEVFLRSHMRLEGHYPAYFEVPFGFGPGEVRKAGFGKAEPVEIKLPENKRFQLSGRIDRIDRRDDGYVVIDYKTGSPRSYKEHSYLNRGRQIQHVLYSFAAEQLLKECGAENPKVVEAGYFFPTEIGEGKLVMHDQTQKEIALELLECLFDLIQKGSFHVVDDEKDEACSYCDYGQVCRKAEAVKKIKGISASDPALESWRKVKSYG